MRFPTWLVKLASLDALSLTWSVAGVILQLIDYEMVSAPVVYEWIQRKKQAEQDVKNEVL